MSPTLPPRPNLDWLRKTAKERLAQLRVNDPSAKLADAQRELAREYGFPSWRKLKAHVEAPPPPAPTADDIIKAFFRLVGTGEIDRVRAALDAAPQLVHAVGPHPFWGGRPQALHVSIETGRRDLFELLLERGADVNGRNDQYDQWSPLMLAIQRKHDDMRDELLRRGARVELVEALMLGDDARADSRIDELLARGLPDVVPNGGSILAFARTTHAIDRLIDLGASVDAKDRWSASPIDSISRLGEQGTPLVRHLIARGANASPKDYARLGDLESLAKDPANALRDDVMTAAVDFRHHALVEWLLAHGANVNAREPERSHQTALHNAAWNGDLRMAQMLIAAGADPTLRDNEHNETAAGWAEVSRKITNNPKCDEVAEFLRAHGT